MAEKNIPRPDRLPIKLILPSQGKEKRIDGGGTPPKPFRTVDGVRVSGNYEQQAYDVLVELGAREQHVPLRIIASRLPMDQECVRFALRSLMRKGIAYNVRIGPGWAYRLTPDAVRPVDRRGHNVRRTAEISGSTATDP